MHRDIALHRAGAVESYGDLFIVSGKARNYTVSLPANGDPHCDHPDYAKRRATCKHGYAILIHGARACRRAKTARPRTDRRHTDSLKGVLTDLDRLDRATQLSV